MTLQIRINDLDPFWFPLLLCLYLDLPILPSGQQLIVIGLDHLHTQPGSPYLGSCLEPEGNRHRRRNTVFLLSVIRCIYTHITAMCLCVCERVYEGDGTSQEQESVVNLIVSSSECSTDASPPQFHPLHHPRH